MKLPKGLFTFSSACKRFVHTQPKIETCNQWIKPIGFETDIKVYNPVSKCKTPLILRNKQFLTWYMCGPTLYDSAHIGHACTYIRFDTIRRILNDIFNIEVIQIMGLTDIDDKIIQRSKETKKDWKQLTKFYEKEFFEDMDKLNVMKPYHSCRVTDYVPQIIDFVKEIINKGYAYVTEQGSVYFDTLKYQNYGKLGTPEEVTETTNKEKKSALDFALWKASKEGEPFWQSPWGIGRPGWHIECSVVASTIFGSNIDIHSGGIDLAFPHHENEEAQSCCYHGEDQWVNYWLHTGHLYLKDNVKMSKSLQNTISIRASLEMFTVNEFRLLCLMTNYRNGIEFSDIATKTTTTTMKKIEHFLQCCNDYVSGKLYKGVIDEPTLIKALNETKDNVLNALKDDFNTGKAISCLINLIGLTNKMFHKDEIQTSARSTVAVAAVSNYVSSILTKLGVISLKTNSKNEENLTGIIESCVEFRSIARNIAINQREKDVTLLNACDDVRKNLAVYGVEIKDFKQKSTWTFVKK